jgi:hypothetical protein
MFSLCMALPGVRRLAWLLYSCGVCICIFSRAISPAEHLRHRRASTDMDLRCTHLLSTAGLALVSWTGLTYIVPFRGEPGIVLVTQSNTPFKAFVGISRPPPLRTGVLRGPKSLGSNGNNWLFAANSGHDMMRCFLRIMP